MIPKRKRDILMKKITEVTLKKRAKAIFIAKYGLKDGIYKSNAEVGRKYGISREAVRLTLKKVQSIVGDVTE